LNNLRAKFFADKSLKRVFQQPRRFSSTIDSQLRNGHSGRILTFDMNGGITICVERLKSFPEPRHCSRSCLRGHSYIHRRRSVFSQLLSGAQSWHAWQRRRNAATSIPRDSSRPSTAGGRSWFSQRSRRSLLRATRPMLFLYSEREGKIHRRVEDGEATIGTLNPGDLFGEGCLTGQPFRMSSATAMTDCSVSASRRSP
jgi:hypothetical protein